MDRIEAKLPFKVKYPEPDLEFERLVSFATKVESLAHYFETKADKVVELLKK